jgi:hypothetical protein
MPALDAGIFFLDSREDDRVKPSHDEKLKTYEKEHDIP